MSKLADAITKAVEDSGQVGIATGQVTAIPTPKVTVAVSSGSLTLPRLASYSPTIGDVVLILTSPAGWIVLGKVATT